MKERLQKIEKNQRKTRKKNICKNNKKQIRRTLGGTFQGKYSNLLNTYGPQATTDQEQRFLIYTMIRLSHLYVDDDIDKLNMSLSSLFETIR